MNPWTEPNVNCIQGEMATVRQHETESMKLFKQRAIEKYGFPIGVEDNINVLLESDIYKDSKDPSFNEFWRYF